MDVAEVSGSVDLGKCKSGLLKSISCSLSRDSQPGSVLSLGLFLYHMTSGMCAGFLGAMLTGRVSEKLKQNQDSIWVLSVSSRKV